MGGGEDLLVAAPFADDLVVTSLSRRGFQRARGRHGTGQFAKVMYSYGPAAPGMNHERRSQLETWTTVPSLQVFP